MKAFRGVKNYTPKKNQATQTETTVEVPDLEPVTEEQILRDKQWNAIERLLEGKSMQAAADETGINVRTLRRWMHTPEFAEQYHFARRRQIDNNAATLQAASDAGIATLLRHCTCGDLRAEYRAGLALAKINEKSQCGELRNRIAELAAILQQQNEYIQHLESQIQSRTEQHDEPESTNSTEDIDSAAAVNSIAKSLGSALPGLAAPLPDHTQQLMEISKMPHQNSDIIGLEPVAA